ncbi:uncharacterized protein [Cherax quadricarinatus]|uniref:uncharacterized protein n=1 Tax=Cherax quadricarinatus TaxID=27406 RepID=UPI00387E361B
MKGSVKENKSSMTQKGAIPDTLLELLKVKMECHQPNQQREGECGAKEVSGRVVGSQSCPEQQQPSLDTQLTCQEPRLMSGENLRTFAYEGDGSSSGSLTSAISVLRAELETEASIQPLVPEFSEVIDLLRNLPEAPRSTSSLAKISNTKSTSSEQRKLVTKARKDDHTSDEITATSLNQTHVIVMAP